MAEKKLNEYLAKCHQNVNQTDYFTRIGICNDSINHFNLGYDAEYHVNEKETWKVVIIPTSEQSYEAINIEDNESVKRCKRYGFAKIFNRQVLYENHNKPICVCQDPVDAIIIMQVGGLAVSVGNSANYKLLIDELDKQQLYSSHEFILMFHNDERSIECQNKLEKMLASRNILFINGKDIIKNYISIQEKYLNSTTDLRVFLSEYENRLLTLKAKKEVSQNITENNNKASAADLLNDFKKKIQENAKKPKMSTGIPSIDKALDGGLMPWLYIIGGMSSVGKTTLVLQIADNLAKQGIDVLFFSLEQSEFDLMSKSISRETYLYCQDNKIDTSNAKSNLAIIDGRRWENFNITEMAVIDAAFENYEKFAEHVFIYEGVGNIGVNAIRKSINAHIKNTGNKNIVVFVDYLQILKASKQDKNATDKQIIDHNVTALKQLSRDFDIPILAISSLNRQNYNSAINMSSFKESGSIEYGADVLIGIQLKGAGEKYFDVEKVKSMNPRPIEINILKYRNGQIMSKGIDLTYHTTFNCFETNNKVNSINHVTMQYRTKDIRKKQDWQQQIMEELKTEPLPFA